MPMPSNGTAWPLPGQADHLQDVAEYGAWYAGDPDQLEQQYGGGSGSGLTVQTSNRPMQFSGGIAGRIARWWWGQPTVGGEQRTKLHIPLAADIAGASADLLFAEPVSWVTAEGDTRMAEFVTGMQDEGLDAQVHEGAEVCSALGDTYLRVRWDREVSPRPWLDPVQADGAWPEYRHGRLHAVTLWSQLPNQGKSGDVFRLLERHEQGRIEYALFVGTLSNLGIRHPLEAHTETADLAPLVNEDGWQETGTARFCVQHVPNMLPNRKRRRSHQGRSDLQGVLPILDALDETYSSWMRDVRLAKARIHVPAQFMESDGPGQGGNVYLDREVYVPMDGVLAKSNDGLGSMFQVQQFAIRTADHMATAQDLIAQAIRSAGYSLATFGGEGEGGAMTATEVRAKRERSYTTRDKKVRYWTAGLNNIMAAAVDIANEHLSAGLSGDAPRVQFPDGVQESVLSLANTAQALRNAEAASVETRVRMVHPDWSDTDVQAEAGRIIAENGGPAEPLPNPEDPGL